METFGRTVDVNELDKFSALSDDWWEDKGAFSALHKLTPARMMFLREALLNNRLKTPDSKLPFLGMNILDVGCGGGLLAEPMARLGANVTGVDASKEAITVASRHAKASGLDIKYIAGDLAAVFLETKKFDVVIASEVIEHVLEPRVFIRDLSKLLHCESILIITTINRSLKSLLTAKILAEYILRLVPAGTHKWGKFIRPTELKKMMGEVNLEIQLLKGISYSVGSDNFVLTENAIINYAISAALETKSN